MKKSIPPIEKHKDHEMEVIDGPFGHHAGKLVCKECGKWVMWLPNNYKEILNEQSKTPPLDASLPYYA